jgi:hypothetical protein
LKGGEPNPLLPAPAPAAARNAITSPDAPPTPGERIASWVYVRMRQRGHSDDVIHDFLDAEGLPREPTTVSAVKRIAGATGATATEVLALLGIEDMTPQRESTLRSDSNLKAVPDDQEEIRQVEATLGARRAETGGS